MTNNPKSDWDATFLPKETTVAGWGNAAWEPFGPMTDFIEYPQCTAAQEKDWVSLPWATSQAMASPDWTAGGLTDKWAWQSFLIPYFKGDTTKTDQYKTAYGFNDEQLENFIYNMRVYVQDRIFGGAYTKLTIENVLYGYVNDVASKVNGGNYFLGDDFALSNTTTPIIND